MKLKTSILLPGTGHLAGTVVIVGPGAVTEGIGHLKDASPSVGGVLHSVMGTIIITDLDIRIVGNVIVPAVAPEVIAARVKNASNLRIATPCAVTGAMRWVIFKGNAR